MPHCQEQAGYQNSLPASMLATRSPHMEAGKPNTINFDLESKK
jgi:hypothetical protein